MLPKIVRGIRTLVARALEEHAAPRQVGLSVALGTFCACTPLLGFHLWLALGLATFLRLNRLWAAVGSRATTVPVIGFVVFGEIQLAHCGRTGSWASLSPHEALAHGPELMLDWVLGTPIVGGVYAAALGTMAFALARQRLRRLTPSTPGEPLAASSESPPSAPPTPLP